MPKPTKRFADEKEVSQHLIGKVKEGRVSIDGMIKYVERIRQVENQGKGGREFSLAITKLEEAKMWLGKALGALGSELPAEYRDEATLK